MRAPYIIASSLIAVLTLVAFRHVDKGETAIILDGDSLRFKNKEVRLWGIDAPEYNQTCFSAPRPNQYDSIYQCGQDAKRYLVQLIADRKVHCTPYDTDKYNRTVAECFVGSINLNASMVWAGHAVDYVRYSAGHYASQQYDAQAHKRGIWQGKFTQPEEYRHNGNN